MTGGFQALYKSAQNVVALAFVGVAFGWLLWKWRHRKGSGCNCGVCPMTRGSQANSSSGDASLISEDQLME